MRSSNVLSFTWDVTGTKIITITAINSLGSATDVYTTVVTLAPSSDYSIYLPTILRESP
jgi:hypothetical protein